MLLLFEFLQAQFEEVDLLVYLGVEDFAMLELGRVGIELGDGVGSFGADLAGHGGGFDVEAGDSVALEKGVVTHR